MWNTPNSQGLCGVDHLLCRYFASRMAKKERTTRNMEETFVTIYFAFAFRLKQDAALDLKWKTKNVEALRKPAASHFRWESILYHGFASPFFKTRKTGCLLVPHKLQQSTSTLAAQRILYAKRRLGGPPRSGGGQPPRFLHLFPRKSSEVVPMVVSSTPLYLISNFNSGWFKQWRPQPLSASLTVSLH